MIVEYVGIADRWAGPGVVHTVRAFWRVLDESDGKVKRAAMDAVRREVTGHVEYVGRDLDTYHSPNLAAIYRLRVLTRAEFEYRAEMRKRVYTRCDGCGGDHPGWLVCMEADNTVRALCFGCWDPIKDTCKVLHWIKADGKLQV